MNLATLAAASLLLPFTSPAALAGAADIEPDAVMIRTPDVSRDQIVFRYADDLWLVDKQGGIARRITSAPGIEAFPRFDPAGERIAFQASYDGSGDLYTLPVQGGVPSRVTFHPGRETLCDWTPDGEELVYFSTESAGLRRAARLMRVGVAGTHPVPLPLPYATFGSIDETGDWLAYTPASREFRTWKRYRGGLAQDIWLFHLRTFESRRLTDFDGTDAQPMWHGRSIVFSSDRDTAGILNLWSVDVDSGELEQLTFFSEYGVRFASMGPEDVVFENGGRLYRLQLSDRQVVPVEVLIPGDRPELRPIDHDLSDSIAGAAAGPTAKRAVVEARGELFSVPVDEGVTRNLTHSDGVAERSPSWSPDGRFIAYFSDASGEVELCLRRPDGKPFEGSDDTGAKRLTSLGPGWRSDPHWSPDSKKVLFSGADGSLWCAWIEEDRYERIAVHPGGFPLEASWSPHSDWIAWSHPHSESELDAIFLYELESGFTHEVTSGMFDDSEPVFDAAGDFLFFHSTRHFQPRYADLDTTFIYAETRRLVAVPLRSDVENPFAPENEEEPIEGEGDGGDEEGDEEDGEDAGEDAGEDDGEDDGEGDGDGDDDEAEDPAGEDSTDEEGDGEDDEDEEQEPESLEIDLERFEARAMLLPVEHGLFGSLAGLDGTLLYVRQGGRGSDDPPRIERYELGEDEPETVLEGAGDFALTADGEHLLVSVDGKLGFVGTGPDQKLEDTLDTSGLRMRADPRAEWRQMLLETWRLFRDFFYDEGMHGLDWNAVRERYLAALADVTSRDDLTYLTGEMMAELNVGHAYNGRPPGSGNGGGGDGAAGLLGADLELDGGAYRITRIVGGGPYDADARSPLARPDLDVAVGDYVLSVNGVPVDPAVSFHAAMLGTQGRPTELVVNASPAVNGEERTIVVEPIGSDTALRFRDWVHTNRERVEELSGGRVGYVYVPDTGINGQNELLRQFYAERHHDALLVDERWNGGGQIPTRFVELLDRPLTNFWAVRHGEDWDWPPVGHRGPKAMLINGWAGSGGDAFPYYFRQKGLGPLIGQRTWGGLVGLSGNPSLIDGTNHAIPRFAFYELDGTWGVEGHGVEPDIPVVDDPTALARGGDPQLEAAVTWLLEELERTPPVSVPRPTGPDRSGSGLVPADR